LWNTYKSLHLWTLNLNDSKQLFEIFSADPFPTWSFLHKIIMNITYLPKKSSFVLWSLSQIVISSSWLWSSYKVKSNCSSHRGFKVSKIGFDLYLSLDNLENEEKVFYFIQHLSLIDWLCKSHLPTKVNFEWFILVFMYANGTTNMWRKLC